MNLVYNEIVTITKEQRLDRNKKEARYKTEKVCIFKIYPFTIKIVEGIFDYI